MPWYNGIATMVPDLDAAIARPPSHCAGVRGTGFLACWLSALLPWRWSMHRHLGTDLGFSLRRMIVDMARQINSIRFLEGLSCVVA